MNEPNAIVEYIDEITREVVATDRFYDPGLDEGSWLARELKALGRWQGKHLFYGCGRAL